MTMYTYTLSAEDWVEEEVTCDETEIEDHARAYAESGINWDGDWEWTQTVYQDVSWKWVDSDGDEQIESTIVAFDPPEPPCRGETEHDWIDKEVNGREECRHCLMSRWVNVPRWIVLISGLSLDNATARHQCVTYVAHDDERASASFVTWVEQTQGIDEERNVRWTKRIAVRTDGSDFRDDWSDMTEEERDEHDEWVERLHDARVQIAELDPEDREWIDAEVDGQDGDDPDVLEGAIEALAAANEEVA